MTDDIQVRLQDKRRKVAELAIAEIVRRRPDLQGKTPAEIIAILKQEERRPKRRAARRVE